MPRFVKRKVSMTRACECLGISRRRVKYTPAKNDDELVKRMIELSQQHRRAGARQLRRLLKRQGFNVNLKRVCRLCKAHGLLLGRAGVTSDNFTTD